MKTRIDFLDNLRTFMILLVIVLHAGIVYAPMLDEVWIVKDRDQSSMLGILIMYLDIFIMFVLFFISGYFTRSSAINKSAKAFIFSKFKRLMVPWMVAVLALIPLYKLIFLNSRGMPAEEWYTYFHLYSKPDGPITTFADNPSMSWLWFLPVLFVFQLVYLVLLRSGGLKIKLSLPSAIVITLIAGAVFSTSISLLNLNGWYDSILIQFQKERLPIYFMVFLLGSLAGRLSIFNHAPQSRKGLIISGSSLIPLLAVYTPFALNLLMNIMNPGRDNYFISAPFDVIIFYLTQFSIMFCCLYILIRVFRTRFNQPFPVYRELARNSYLVYVIHLIVLGGLAYILLNISMPGLVKFVILVISTFLVSNIMVSAYRRTMQKTLSSNLAVYIMLPLALSLGILVKAAQSSDFPQIEKPATIQSEEPLGIHLAAVRGDLASIRYHIENGTDIELQEPSAQSTPLITAALFGHAEVVHLLLDAGADVNFQNKDGSTALHTAAFFCHPDIVELLIEYGANKQLMNNAGATALSSVQAPFSAVKGVYEYFKNTLGPLGLNIDYDEIKSLRPVISAILSEDANTNQSITQNK